MGIDASGSLFLAFARSQGVDFTSTITLGKQARFGATSGLVASLNAFGFAPPNNSLGPELQADPSNVEPLFRALGASSVEALDFSTFEGATVLHDLNEPLPLDLEDRWTCVVDGGLTEHVFHFPTALESSMKMVAEGGHLIVIVPTNQQSGHGFYQLSAEVYYRALTPENGFEVRGAFVQEDGLRSRWYRLEDPAEAGHRITVSTVGPATLYVVAKRIGAAGVAVTPQQSDYAKAWTDAAEASDSGTLLASPPRAWRTRVYRRLGPRLGPLLLRAQWIVRAARQPQLERVDLRDPSIGLR